MTREEEPMKNCRVIAGLSHQSSEQNGTAIPMTSHIQPKASWEEKLRNLLEKQGVDFNSEDGQHIFSEQKAFISQAIAEAERTGHDRFVEECREAVEIAGKRAILEERRRLEEVVKEMKKDNITAGRIGQVTMDDCTGYNAACREFIRLINQKNV